MAIQLRCLYQSDDDLARLRSAAESLGLKEYQTDSEWHGYYRRIEFFDDLTVGEIFKEKRRILSEIKRDQKEKERQVQDADADAAEKKASKVLKKNRQKYQDN